jgi:hypothetical protein
MRPIKEPKVQKKKNTKEDLGKDQEGLRGSTYS